MIKLVNKYFPEITDVQTEKLIILHELFETYNKKINLISNNSLNNFFVEHVLHSLSISKIKHFNKKEIVLDIGSGGGFPGIPLAIIFPNTHFILIDSISKKTNMIKKFKAELSLKNIKVINDRIENLKASNIKTIIARAFSPLKSLILKVRHCLCYDTTLVLHKGRTHMKEIIEAKSLFYFNYKCYDSATNSDAKILKIDNIKEKNE